MTQSERKAALDSMTPALRAEYFNSCRGKGESRARTVGSTKMTQSKQTKASPNPALDYRRGETQRKPGTDSSWRVRTLELEKAHSKKDNTVRYENHFFPLHGDD